MEQGSLVFFSVYWPSFFLSFVHKRTLVLFCIESDSILISVIFNDFYPFDDNISRKLLVVSELDYENVGRNKQYNSVAQRDSSILIFQSNLTILKAIENIWPNQNVIYHLRLNDEKSLTNCSKIRPFKPFKPSSQEPSISSMSCSWPFCCLFTQP